MLKRRAMAAAVAVAVGDIPAPPSSSCLDMLPKTGAAKFLDVSPGSQRFVHDLYMTCILVHFCSGASCNFLLSVDGFDVLRRWALFCFHRGSRQDPGRVIPPALCRRDRQGKPQRPHIQPVGIRISWSWS